MIRVLVGFGCGLVVFSFVWSMPAPIEWKVIVLLALGGFGWGNRE